jgi:purine-binding chemotaxis protein CheW
MEERYGTRCGGMRALNHVKAAPEDSPSDMATSTPPLGETAQWVMFGLDTGRYAISLATVDRIVRAAYVTPLPLAPGIVLGAINVEGCVLPVFNVRRRFRLPERNINPADHFLIAHAAQRRVVLVVDAAQGVIEHPSTAVIDAASIAPGLAHIRGVIRLEDGLVLIHDLEQFLSMDESHALDEAMNQEAALAS